jgi:alpha/beta superfamily hydrolase
LIEDTRSAAVWLKQNTGLPRVAVGYSFGSYAVTAAELEPLAGLVLVLPTLTHHDFERARCSSVPKLVIYSSDDFATPSARVERWLASVSDPVRSVCVEGARHFFQGLESRVNEVCRSFLNECVLREVHHGH